MEKLEVLSDTLTQFVDRNRGTLWQVVKAYEANARQGTVRVKTRAMVKSTGKKPYKQKKTGNARRGTFVANLHVGGGVSHGPQPREHRQVIPLKMAKVALGIALAARVQAGKIFIGDLNIASGRTKDAFVAIKSVLSAVGTTLVCLDTPSPLTVRALRNIRGVQLMDPTQVNARDLVKARVVVASQKAFDQLQARLLDSVSCASGPAEGAV